MRNPVSNALLVGLASLFLFACASQQVVTEPAPTADYLSGDGVYQVESYTDLPDAPEYAEATVYYPADKTEPFGAVAIAPGFTETQDAIDWWGPRLASHGYAVLIFNTNQPRDYPILRADGLIAAIEVLHDENSRSGSPLRGKLDTDRMAVMGHSMGGGGALLAAHGHSDRVRAAIPFTPWQPDADFSGITVPTLVIAGETDRIAKVAEHAWPHYQAIPDSTTKVYLEFAGGNHFIGNSARSNLDVHPQMGRYAIAWLKLHVDGDSAYAPFIFGDVPNQDKDILSRFEINRP
ncbi:alpha/beta hydrolase family protein [Gilvimarinus sp. F26214L]|uniref:alpha/beta hydrolase family protein n=1 Tax=Gilvimarinus sp. DZF01 TaxID=3461371 RepID=UPI00404663C7